LDITEGDANFQGPAALIGDTTRARILLALLDGRALPASMLAAETGMAPSTVSEHLTRLVEGGLLRARRQGRHRYYTLASAQVASALEALALLTPASPVRSLRAGTRQRAMRTARTCYDHLAGRLGVAVMTALIEAGALTGGDGRHVPDPSGGDRLAAAGRDLDYTVTASGWALLDRIGVVRPDTRRPLVRYCVDWTEQRHHLAGALGASLLSRLLDLGWLSRAPRGRVIRIEPAGAAGLRDWLGLDLGDLLEAPAQVA
jgi:DNA-binding transcriptional ArsR family regulator